VCVFVSRFILYCLDGFGLVFGFYVCVCLFGFFCFMWALIRLDYPLESSGRPLVGAPDLSETNPVGIH